MKEQIHRIRAELFRLCKEAKSFELIHWYVAIDECFENDEFQRDEAENLRWRLQALSWQNAPIGYLTKLITPILEDAGIVENGKWVQL